MLRICREQGLLLVALTLFACTFGCTKDNPAYDGVAGPDSGIGQADAAAGGGGGGGGGGSGGTGPSSDAQAMHEDVSSGSADVDPASDAIAPADASITVDAAPMTDVPSGPDAGMPGPDVAPPLPDGLPAPDLGPPAPDGEVSPPDATPDQGGADGAPEADARPDLGLASDLAMDARPVIGTYVATEATRGDDGNPGTQASPVRTIAQGMKNAEILLGQTGVAQTVFVAEGHYDEKVVLIEGISLRGGHQCNVDACSWARDPKVFKTEIHDVDDEGVLAPATVSRKTRIEGFGLLAATGDPSATLGSAAMTLEGGSPTIFDNVIQGAGVTGGTKRSVALEVLGSTSRLDVGGALIDQNTILGGDAASESIALAFEAKASASPGAAAVATVTLNDIHGGDAPNSFAIFASRSGSATLVKRNFISAGTSDGHSWGIVVSSVMTIDGNEINRDQATGSCAQSDSWCGGILSLSSSSVIANNLVFGTNGPRTAAIYLQEVVGPAGTCIVNGNTLDGSAAGAVNAGTGVSAAIAVQIGMCDSCNFKGFVGRVRNNVLLGGANQQRYGVYEEGVLGKTIHLEALTNNDFFFAPVAASTDVVYHMWKGDHSGDFGFAELNMIATASDQPVMNFNADPLLDGAWHLGPGSPCIDKGTAKEASVHDIDGDGRPKGLGVDIGADEAQ